MRTAHLGMIQGVIGRIASVSAGIKGFAVTGVAALLATGTVSPVTLTVIILIFIALMGIADAAYLGMEKEFRAFYELVVARPLGEAADMRIVRPTAHFDAFGRALRSWSVLGVYPPLALLAAGAEVIKA